MIIFVAGQYSLLQCAQLFTCTKLGATIIFVKGDRAACDEQVRQLAAEKHLIVMDPQLNRPVRSHSSCCVLTCATSFSWAY